MRAEGIHKNPVFKPINTLEVVPCRVISRNIQVSQFVFADAEGKGRDRLGVMPAVRNERKKQILLSPLIVLIIRSG